MVEVDTSTLPGDFDPTPTGDPDGDGDNVSEPIVVGPGDVFVNADWGYAIPDGGNPSGGGHTIGDTVYLDANADGTQDAGEEGIPGVSVALIDTDSGEVIATTVTDGAGMFEFPGLPDGDYTVMVTDSNNVLGELEPLGDADGGSDEQSSLTLSGADNLDQDFGYVPDGHTMGEGLIGDTVFLDTNSNSAPDPGEGLEGVVVELLNDMGMVIDTTTTDENGNYHFGGLDPSGTYTGAGGYDDTAGGSEQYGRSGWRNAQRVDGESVQ